MRKNEDSARHDWILICLALVRFVCSPSSHTSPDLDISPWHIFQKVFLEILFWGTGTAIGELPPFFVAKAGKLLEDATPHTSISNFCLMQCMSINF